MTREMIASQIKSLELQLAVLRAEIKHLGEPTAPYYLGDLEGDRGRRVSREVG